MNLPGPTDYIDIHTHGSGPVSGVFSLENLMAHEDISPADIQGIAFTSGIHPWYLNENNQYQLVDIVRKNIEHPSVIAVGEAGIDKLRGPSLELQRKVFEQQISIAEEHEIPVVIHSVRAWDELLSEHKKLRPKMPWLIHGFRGKRELALQLISKGMFISFWYEFVIRPESADLIRNLPRERIFLETDGADIRISEVYAKVSSDLGISVDILKSVLFKNFKKYFNL
ncbi:MAG: TatD family hydrolase [Bacteroidales bacterium]|nr:TatD family hydrolase [Bacteroidales bacterium]